MVTDADRGGFDLTRYDRIEWSRCESGEVSMEGVCEFDTTLWYALEEPCEASCEVVGRDTTDPSCRCP